MQHKHTTNVIFDHSRFEDVLVFDKDYGYDTEMPQKFAFILCHTHPPYEDKYDMEIYNIMIGYGDAEY